MSMENKMKLPADVFHGAVNMLKTSPECAAALHETLTGKEGHHE